MRRSGCAAARTGAGTSSATRSESDTTPSRHSPSTRGSDAMPRSRINATASRTGVSNATVGVRWRGVITASTRVASADTGARSSSTGEQPRAVSSSAGVASAGRAERRRKRTRSRSVRKPCHPPTTTAQRSASDMTRAASATVAVAGTVTASRWRRRSWNRPRRMRCSRTEAPRESASAQERMVVAQAERRACMFCGGGAVTSFGVVCALIATVAFMA
mmetsp:Transcript_20103/g.59934  ORF Transcript_20103/g.59934 Transcript_20103/m.59934 type:complete len:218 (-) Transcript_20103:154-807(-)